MFTLVISTLTCVGGHSPPLAGKEEGREGGERNIFALLSESEVDVTINLVSVESGE